MKPTAPSTRAQVSAEVKAALAKNKKKPTEHEGATEAQTGDRTGPAAGYDAEPAQVKDDGGVSGG